MKRAVTLAALVLLLAMVARAWSQPAQGFGPTFDATNSALRVNVVAGGGSGGTSSNFGAAFPGTGTAIGGKDPSGAMASFTISNTGRLQVTCDNCSSSAATFGQGFPTSGGPVGFKDALGSFASVSTTNGLPVNVIAGGGGGATVGTAYPSTVNPAGFKDSRGALASATVDNSGRQNVTIGADSTLIATVTGTVTANQGASAVANNAWPVNVPDDAGVMVRPGDATNKALRVNIVAGSVGSSSTFGTAFPTTGSAAGFRDSLGAMASATVDNSGRLNVNITSASTIIATVTGTVTSNQGTAGVPWNVRTSSDSTLTATVTQANASNLNATVAQGAAGVPWNVRTSSDSTLTATVTQTTAANLQTTATQGPAGVPWNVRTSSDSTLTATVTQTTAANLNALVAQGASAAATNAWPVVAVSDAGVMVRPGDDTNKAIRVNVVAGSGGGLSVQDSAAWTAAVSNFVPNGGVFNDSAAALTSGQQGTVRQTANRAMHQNQRDSAGQELGATLPGGVNTPVQTREQPTLNALAKPTLSQLTADNRAVKSGVGSPAWGAGQIIAMLSDGTSSAVIAKPNRSPAVTDPALVVTQSPAPSLQCPNTTPINQSASATLINGTAGKTTFICTLSVIAQSATRISLTEGTGTTCGTAALGLIGGTSASVGLAATGGFHGVSDRVTIPGRVPGNNVCLIQDTAVPVAGIITWGQY